MKEVINKTDKFIVYKYGDVYRVHFYKDEKKTILEPLKSFITRNYGKVKENK